MEQAQNAPRACPASLMQQRPYDFPWHCYERNRYWAIALAVLEKAVLELEPIKRMVPTTRTKITASTTAFFPPGVWAESKANAIPPVNGKNHSGKRGEIVGSDL